MDDNSRGKKTTYEAWQGYERVGKYHIQPSVCDSSGVPMGCSMAVSYKDEQTDVLKRWPAGNRT